MLGGLALPLVQKHTGPFQPQTAGLLFQHINPVAASLIQKMLRSDPATRPTIDELLNDEFFTSGYIPARLPTTCLTVPPRFSITPTALDANGRKPLTALNKGGALHGKGGSVQGLEMPRAGQTVSVQG